MAATTTRLERIAWRYLCEAKDWEIWLGARQQLAQQESDDDKQEPDDVA